MEDQKEEDHKGIREKEERKTRGKQGRDKLMNAFLAQLMDWR